MARPKEGKEKVHTTISIEKKVYEMVKEAAKQDKRTLSNFIEVSLERYLNNKTYHA